MTDTTTGGGPRRGFSLKHAIYLVFSLASTVGIFAYLFRHVTPGQVMDLIADMDLRGVAMFLVLSFSMSAFRLWRYHVLLRLSGWVPPSLPLFLTVLVRNFFSDLLPARIGTLIYVYLVTTRLGVPFSAAGASFSLSFVFDMIALVPLILLGAWGAGAVGHVSPHALVVGAGILAAATVIVLVLLPRLFRLAARITAALPLLPRATRGTWAEALDQVGGEVRKAQSAGVYGRVLALSVMVRVAKYASLYVLLYAMLAPMGYTWDRLPVSRVFLGMCASELAASLPISGIAGFGVYEGTWATVFEMLGFPGDISKLTSISHHLFTQVYGYSLGGLALVALLLPVFRAARPPAADLPVRDRPPAFYAKLAGLTLLVFGLLFAVARIPSCGPKLRQADRPTADETAARAAFATEFGADVVFDSTRSGTFGIWRMHADGSGLTAVADDPVAHEMYPDPSPDGRWIVFSKNVSLSKRAPASVWICRADGSEPRKLAENGTYPTFSADGATVYFERERRLVMGVAPDGSGERQVFPGAKGFGKYEVVKPRVSADGRRVVFVSNRGSSKSWNTWWSEIDGSKSDRIGPGCEPGWFPDGLRATWVCETDMKERVGICMRPTQGGEAAALQDADAPRGHEYFPTVTSDGRFLMWGACRPGEHTHTDPTSNYQLFGRALPDGKPVRLTFDEFNNRWPKRLPAQAAPAP